MIRTKRSETVNQILSNIMLESDRDFEPAIDSYFCNIQNIKYYSKPKPLNIIKEHEQQKQIKYFKEQIAIVHRFIHEILIDQNPLHINDAYLALSVLTRVKGNVSDVQKEFETEIEICTSEMFEQIKNLPTISQIKNRIANFYSSLKTLGNASYIMSLRTTVDEPKGYVYNFIAQKTNNQVDFIESCFTVISAEIQKVYSAWPLPENEYSDIKDVLFSFSQILTLDAMHELLNRLLDRTYVGYLDHITDPIKFIKEVNRLVLNVNEATNAMYGSIMIDYAQNILPACVCFNPFIDNMKSFIHAVLANDDQEILIPFFKYVQCDYKPEILNVFKDSWEDEILDRWSDVFNEADTAGMSSLINFIGLLTDIGIKDSVITKILQRVINIKSVNVTFTFAKYIDETIRSTSDPLDDDLRFIYELDSIDPFLAQYQMYLAIRLANNQVPIEREEAAIQAIGKLCTNDLVSYFQIMVDDRKSHQKLNHPFFDVLLTKSEAWPQYKELSITLPQEVLEWRSNFESSIKDKRKKIEWNTALETATILVGGFEVRMSAVHLSMWLSPISNKPDDDSVLADLQRVGLVKWDGGAFVRVLPTHNIDVGTLSLLVPQCSNEEQEARAKQIRRGSITAAVVRVCKEAKTLSEDDLFVGTCKEFKYHIGREEFDEILGEIYKRELLRGENGYVYFALD